MMDIRKLRYFVCMVEAGSVAKASRQLFIAQPALSQQLSKLEDEIGKQLLARSYRGVTPTESGWALYHHARFLLRQLDQVMSIARQEGGEIRGVVSVGLPSTTSAAIGLPLLKRMRQRYPGVLLNIIDGLSGHIEQMIRLGEVDLAVLFRGDVSPDLKCDLLLEEELCLLLANDSQHVGRHVEWLTMAEAAKLPLILPTRVHGLRQRVSAEFDQRGLEPRLVAEVDSLPIVLSAVSEDIGVTIKPMSALQLWGASAMPIRAVRISDAKITRRNYLYAIDATRLSSAATAAMGVLEEIAREEVQSGNWRGVTLLS